MKHHNVQRASALLVMNILIDVREASAESSICLAIK